jgi:hypothetical protein
MSVYDIEGFGASHSPLIILSITSFCMDLENQSCIPFGVSVDSTVADP